MPNETYLNLWMIEISWQSYRYICHIYEKRVDEQIGGILKVPFKSKCEMLEILLNDFKLQVILQIHTSHNVI